MSSEHLKENELTGLIIKTYYSVYNQLGYGFSSEIYKNGFASLLRQSSLNFEQNKTITVYLETDALGQISLDFVVEKKVVVQITADDNLELRELNRLKNYLKASEYKIGLLLNFGEKPAYKRRDKLEKFGE